jgi:hypothetical protein
MALGRVKEAANGLTGSGNVGLIKHAVNHGQSIGAGID